MNQTSSETNATAINETFRELVESSLDINPWTVTMLVLAGITVGVRVLMRPLLKIRFGIEDAFLILAMACFVVEAVFSIIGTVGFCCLPLAR